MEHSCSRLVAGAELDTRSTHPPGAISNSLPDHRHHHHQHKQRELSPRSAPLAGEINRRRRWQRQRASKFLTLLSFVVIGAHLVALDLGPGQENRGASQRRQAIISTISCDLLLIEGSPERAVGQSRASDNPNNFQQTTSTSDTLTSQRIATVNSIRLRNELLPRRLQKRARFRRLVTANNVAIFDQQQQQQQQKDSAGLRLKVAAWSSKLAHWLQCQRLGQQLAESKRTHLADGMSASSLAPLDSSPVGGTLPTLSGLAAGQQAACEPHFDGHLCWPPIEVGQSQRLACPKINHTPVPQHQHQQQPAQLKSVIDQSHSLDPTNQTGAIAVANLESITPTGSRAGITTINQDAAAAERASANNTDSGQSDKLAVRKCLRNASPQKQEQQTIGQWELEADYSACQQHSQESSAFDPTDEWVKPDGGADRKLFALLTAQLERIETSIDPYLDLDLLEQWQLCIGEIVRRHEAEEYSSEEASSNNGQRQCPIIFDGWRCWPATRAGEVAYVSCPSNQPGFSAERKAHKICTLDADWYRHPMTNRYWSNYTTCVDTVDLAFRTKILNLYIIGNLISLIALTMSLIIFVSFKSLNCTRVTIHKNLFLSFITNNLMWVVWYVYVVNDANLLQSNPIGCRFWHILLHYFLVSNYFWMFCEGLYLHTILVVAFVSEDKILKWFYMLGWITPIPITLTYAYNRWGDDYYTNFCWMEESPHNIILMAPIGVSLLLNLVFLINIVRVLVTKLRANNSPDTHQTRKAVRATLILIPLLGLHYMLTPFRPEAKSEWETIYEIIAAVCTSFQGLCVALLFCFCNGEVLTALRKWFKDTCLFERHAKRGTMRNRSNTAVSALFNYQANNGRGSNTSSQLSHQFQLKATASGGGQPHTFDNPKQSNGDLIKFNHSQTVTTVISTNGNSSHANPHVTKIAESPPLVEQQVDYSNDLSKGIQTVKFGAAENVCFSEETIKLLQNHAAEIDGNQQTNNNNNNNNNELPSHNSNSIAT